MSTIDILCAFDTAKILALNPTPSKNSNSPTPITSDLLYMIVTKDSSVSGNGTGDLRVKAAVGDQLRWREESLSNNFDTSVLFYNFVSNGQNLITLPPTLVGGIQANGVVISTLEVQPNAAAAPPWLSAGAVQTPYHYWQTTTEAKGSVTYHWQFAISDSRGNLLGYFQWDPYITIE